MLNKILWEKEAQRILVTFSRSQDQIMGLFNNREQDQDKVPGMLILRLSTVPSCPRQSPVNSIERINVCVKKDLEKLHSMYVRQRIRLYGRPPEG